MIRRILLTALLLAACSGREESVEEQPEPEPVEPSFAVDDPDVCAPCHSAVVQEWRASMHARAHQERDPIFAGMRSFRIRREGDRIAARCAQCHSPRSPNDPESEVAQTGVSCASCHMLEGVRLGQGRRGAASLAWSDGVMRGPHDIAEDAPAPHGVGDSAPWLTNGETLCLACHGEMANAEGVPTCTTGSEYEAGEGDETCTSCHMPEVEGASGSVSSRENHRSHAFLGPHSLFTDPPGDFMAGAIELTGELDRRTLRATVVNRARHAVPSGFPGRVVMVRATAYDRRDRIVFRSFTDDPMAQDPDAVFNRTYVDDEDHPAMPPYAARLARDNRLEPDETRTLEWTVPRGTVRAHIEILYRLIPPPLATLFELGNSPEAQGRRVTILEVRPD